MARAGLMRIRRKSASKSIGVIDQSGLDLVFRLDEVSMRVTKSCVLSIRMAYDTGEIPPRMFTKPVGTPTAKAV